MKIDFKELAEQCMTGFKGGNGEYITRNVVDAHCKIMHSILKPGASTGVHQHIGNSEVIYVLSGVATCYYDGEEEKVAAGEAHYCPEGHTHYMVNKEPVDLVYFAVVSEHHAL